MKKWLMMVAALCLLALPCFAEEIALNPEGYTYLGYTDGGITFLVPEDIDLYPPTEQDKAAGFIAVAFGEEITLQLRVFAPDEITWNEFKELILAEPSAEVRFLGENEEILYYRNTEPTVNSELVGIVLNGLDGNMYKISIFTGFNEAFDSEAKVWEMAETIAASARTMDFSEWNLE